MLYPCQIGYTLAIGEEDAVQTRLFQCYMTQVTLNITTKTPESNRLFKFSKQCI